MEMNEENKTKREYCVISHTHWDREWYLPFEQFRLKLVFLIDNLIDLMEKEKNYIFHLDAQTVVLEDYLEIKPLMVERLRKLITEGRLLVGPWYVQNDFNLVSGEATVRNLLIGIKIAKDFGKCMMVGYAPDQFGLVSQLPQIFFKSGIDSCIFGRGKESYVENMEGKPEKIYEKAEFNWVSEDGSSVLGAYLPFWYNNAQRFSVNVEKSYIFIKKIEEQLSVTSSTPYFLLMNGVDHLEAQENLLPILEKLNALLPKGWLIRQTALPDYIDKVKSFAGEGKLARYMGEMRKGDDRNLLQGTLSTRVNLKQRNAYCQMLVENCLEPLYSWLRIAGIGEYPHECINKIWKVLIQNHAHDSICGCHIDDVTAHMTDRFRRVDEIYKYMMNSAQEQISLHINKKNYRPDDYLLCFFNTLVVDRSGAQDVELVFDAIHQVRDFSILGPDGKEIPFLRLDKRKKKVRRFTPINLPSVVDVDSFLVRMNVENVPSQGYLTYTVIPGIPGRKGVPLYNDSVDEEVINHMENDYITVRINRDGTIDLHHKKSGIQYKGLLLLEDREDIGDSYNYMKSETGRSVLSCGFEPLIYQVEKDPYAMQNCIEYSMTLPDRFDYEKRQRSEGEGCVQVKIHLKLDAVCPYLKVKISIDNQVRDHRIRVLFPTSVSTVLSQAGAPFDIVKRDKSQFGPEIISSNEQPFTGFIAVDDGSEGLAIFAKGLYEYENLNDDSNTIAITLLRGNESLYKSDGYAVPEELFVIPENQCMGIHSFELAIYPYTGGISNASVVKKSQEFLIPLLSFFRPASKEKESRGSSFVQDASISEIFTREDPYQNVVLDPVGQFIRLVGRDVELSALKVNEARGSIIVRLYNSAGESRGATIHMDTGIREAYLTDLMEKRLTSLVAVNGDIKGIRFKPKEIITIEIIPA